MNEPVADLTAGTADNPVEALAGSRLAVVVKGYPRLSETFIANEIHALEERGVRILIVSLRHPTDREVHPVHDEIGAEVLYLPEYLHDDRKRVMEAWRYWRGQATYKAARKAWLRDLVRDPTPNRLRRFGQALVLAHELPDDIDRLHAHYLHTPSSVTRYCSILTGHPWTCSAHAKDIWTTPDWEKKEKLQDCQWLVTCTEFGHRHLSDLADDPKKVDLVYHGLDSSRFPRNPASRLKSDGSDPNSPVIILSVGRAVEKKGYDVLIEALSRLPSGLHWRFTHIGGGALLGLLKHWAGQKGVTQRVNWLGPLPQDRILSYYRSADIFVLPSRVAKDGDRDGLPNVLMEAMSQQLACVSTTVSGIPELIEDGKSGLLVPPEDADALAAALTDMITNPARRRAVGQAGEATVRSDFDFNMHIDRVASRFLPGVDT